MKRTIGIVIGQGVVVCGVGLWSVPLALVVAGLWVLAAATSLTNPRAGILLSENQKEDLVRQLAPGVTERVIKAMKWNDPRGTKQ